MSDALILTLPLARPAALDTDRYRLSKFNAWADGDLRPNLAAYCILHGSD